MNYLKRYQYKEPLSSMGSSIIRITSIGVSEGVIGHQQKEAINVNDSDQGER